MQPEHWGEAESVGKGTLVGQTLPLNRRQDPRRGIVLGFPLPVVPERRLDVLVTQVSLDLVERGAGGNRLPSAGDAGCRR